ncbi:hypothetical protein [Schlesneria sp. T3-172]|uniref:hypothetical protein n=1 Tax=Schlesneria sphaerica TaxID=3373610 RepID=UPI0037C92980
MSENSIENIECIAMGYAKTQFDFHNVRVVSVDQITGDHLQSLPCYTVRLELSHSADRIALLASQGDPNETDIKRDFLEGTFTVNLVVCGETVESEEWEDMDLNC